MNSYFIVIFWFMLTEYYPEIHDFQFFVIIQELF
jgi:hypothetical protein